MENNRPITEETVTSQDLQNKWDEIKLAVRRRTQRRVLGMTTATVAGIVVGAGALGLAYWLGRRGAGKSKQQRERPAPGESFVGVEGPQLRSHRPSRVSRVIDPAIDTAVSTAVNATVRSAVNALTGRMNRANERH